MMRLRNIIMLSIFVGLVGYFLIFPVLYHRIYTLVQAWSHPPEHIQCRQGWHSSFDWDHDFWSCVKD